MSVENTNTVWVSRVDVCVEWSVCVEWLLLKIQKEKDQRTKTRGLHNIRVSVLNNNPSAYEDALTP